MTAGESASPSFGINADLAVCVPGDAFFDFTNPLYVNARFRWVIPDAPDLADTFEIADAVLITGAARRPAEGQGPQQQPETAEVRRHAAGPRPW